MQKFQLMPRMPRPLAVSATLVLCALAGGCGRNSSADVNVPPADSAAASAAAQADQDAATGAPAGGSAADERSFDAANVDAAEARESLPLIRKAVREAVKEMHPKASVNGVWALMLRNNYCIAGADTSEDSDRQNLDFLVRLYTREDGSEYWRAEYYGMRLSSHLVPRLLSDKGKGKDKDDARGDND